MNTEDSKSDWNEQKAKLKQKFAVLTDGNALLKEDKKEEMIAKIQIKLGKTREEVLKIIAEL